MAEIAGNDPMLEIERVWDSMDVFTGQNLEVRQDVNGREFTKEMFLQDVEAKLGKGWFDSAIDKVKSIWDNMWIVGETSSAEEFRRQLKRKSIGVTDDSKKGSTSVTGDQAPPDGFVQLVDEVDPEENDRLCLEVVDQLPDDEMTRYHFHLVKLFKSGTSTIDTKVARNFERLKLST